MITMQNPVFIFSLPRSGSTLLQRILMSHKDIASLAEPWILLPIFYSFRSKGIISEYSQSVQSIAVKDFISNLPNKEIDYYSSINKFISDLYSKQCTNNEKYFLDKTPRYYYIIDEIEKVFPDAKFIFLFRNPVHVFSSIVETWCNGSFSLLHDYNNDLIIGPKKLSQGFIKLKNKAYALKYEDLINKPLEQTRNICEYLNIPFDEKMLSNFTNQNTKGRFGDKTGKELYKKIEDKSLDKWKQTFKNKLRIRILKSYIEKIDSDTLGIQGYDKKQIMNNLQKLNTVSLFSLKDYIQYNRSKIIYKYNLSFFLSKERKEKLHNNYYS